MIIGLALRYAAVELLAKHIGTHRGRALVELSQLLPGARFELLTPLLEELAALPLEDRRRRLHEIFQAFGESGARLEDPPVDRAHVRIIDVEPEKP